MKDTITYQIGDNLYINLTNRCSFCVREGKETYEGYALWLKAGEPSAEQIIGEIGDPTRYHEIVFCGFGEPTFRLEEMCKVCDYVHAHGGKTRLNTNGHGSLIHGYDIAPLLKGKLDGVNISLNAPTESDYVALCRPQIAGAFAGMLAFARACRESGVNCWFSVVDCIGKEAVEACRTCAQEIGISLRVREMIE